MDLLPFIFPFLLVVTSAFSQAFTNSAPGRFEVAEPHLGTTVRLVICTDEANAARQAASNAFARVRALDAILSDWKDDSELRRLGRSGTATRVSPDLWNVLTAAREVSRASDGAFDITVGPQVMMWRRARYARRMPSRAVRDQALAATGWKKLTLEDGVATPTVPRMRLDAGGIAKGYIADAVLEQLARDGMAAALVDAGGDLALGKPPPGKTGWRVVIEADPSRTDKKPEVLLLSACGVATSGKTFQFTEIDGVRYSHIVNPKTGLGVTHPWQVTVVAPDAMHADAWASALSVLGPDGFRTITPPSGLSVHWIRRAQTAADFEKP